MLNEQTKGQDSDILVYVNKVRQRAGMPDNEIKPRGGRVIE